jgi:stage II sporulation protein AA (anti-sigma F factor antagonist)
MDRHEIVVRAAPGVKPGFFPSAIDGRKRKRNTNATSHKGNPMIDTDAGRRANVVCKPLGNLDWAAAMSLRHEVRDSVGPGVEIVIDLSPVEFIDAVGMQAVVGSVRLARAFGATARVCNARPPVQRLMELVGVYPLVTGSQAATARGDAANPGRQTSG